MKCPREQLFLTFSAKRAWLAEELVSMIERKEKEGFGDLFIAYFKASNAVNRHFVEIAQQPGREDYIRVAMDAMLDLMASPLK